MGAVKYFHPISLHVIRGAAEYCGWKFGRVRKVDDHSNVYHAEYECEIEKMPRAAEDWPIKTIKGQLQHCFMDDITIVSLWIKPSGQFMARVRVTLDEKILRELKGSQVEGTAL